MTKVKAHYFPNYRCLRAQHSGNLKRFIWQVADHARRLEEWVKGGRSKKWRNWSAVTCSYCVLTGAKTEFTAELLLMLDHNKHEAYPICAIWRGGLNQLTRCMAWLQQHSERPGTLPINIGNHYPSYVELLRYDEEERSCVKLSHRHSISNLKCTELADLNMEELTPSDDPDMIELFAEAENLPAHFPKDFVLRWDCHKCGTTTCHAPHIPVEDTQWLCHDCWWQGLCEACDAWYDREDDLIYFEDEAGEGRRICEDCYHSAITAVVDMLMGDYLRIEGAGQLIEPLEQDPCWHKLCTRYVEYLCVTGDLDEGTMIDFENPQELPDLATRLSGERILVSPRVAWYDKKGWTIRQ